MKKTLYNKEELTLQSLLSVTKCKTELIDNM